MWQEQKGYRPQRDRGERAAGRRSADCGRTRESRLRVDKREPAAAGQESASSGTEKRRQRWVYKREPAAAAGQRELTGGAGKMYK